MSQVAEPEPAPLSVEQLRLGLPSTACAFRGYNVTNLGRTPELLGIPAYESILTEYLNKGSLICSRIKRREVDLLERIRRRRETSLATYDEAIAMIIAVEMAQLAILRTIHEIDVAACQVAYGFSLGEIAALVASGALSLEDALRIPLEMSDDCVGLAHDVTLAVLFSRRGELAQDRLKRLCQEINADGNGVIGVSAILAPNSVLLIGQGDTLDRLSKRKKELSDERVYMRRNDHKWPPLHTPIVWQKNIPNRSMHLMHTMPTSRMKPNPPVFSLVTGSIRYDGTNEREIIGFWIDRPQQLWEAVEHTLSSGIETVLHIGPQPNIIPATFQRLASNVANQTRGSVSMRALSGMAARPWLQSILPKQASLLRAPRVRHVHIEEWLLTNAPRES